MPDDLNNLRLPRPKGKRGGQGTLRGPTPKESLTAAANESSLKQINAGQSLSASSEGRSPVRGSSPLSQSQPVSRHDGNDSKSSHEDVLGIAMDSATHRSVGVEIHEIESCMKPADVC